MKASSVVGLILAVTMAGLVCSSVKGAKDSCRLRGGTSRGMECVEAGK